MKKITELKEKLKVAGKLERISIYIEIIELQVKRGNEEAVISYRKALKIFQEYLEFNSTPTEEVSKSIQEIYLRIFWAIRNYNDTKHFDQIIHEFQTLEHHFKDFELLASIYGHLIYIYWMQSKLDNALECGLESLSKINKCGNERVLTGRYSNVGFIYECQSNFEKAEEYYEKGLEYGLKINSDQVICLSYCGFGRVNLASGNYNVSVNYFQEALKYFPDDQNDDYISVVNNLGIAYGRLNKHEEAISCFSKFLNSNVKEQNPDAYFDLLKNCAVSNLHLNEYEKSEKQFQAALKFSYENNRVDNITGLLVNLGNLEKSRKNWQIALKYYQESISYIKQIDDEHQFVIADLGIGIIYYETKDYEKGKQYLLKSLEGAIKLQQISEIIDSHRYLSMIYEIEGDYKKALEHFKLLKDMQLKEKEDKFNLDICKLKQSYKKDKRQHSQNHFNAGFQLISRELARIIKSPLIGTSTQIQKVVEQAQIAADNSDIPVLISGESGTGKEIIARLIHYSSVRKNKPFVVVNTAAFSDTLIESAFFGCEKGAFTGADSQKKGYFEVAMNGSLFLDEIADMPLAMQVKFLRVLEQKVMQRVGSVKDIPLEFRLISASNKNIHKLADDSAFRFDLLNRINTIEIDIPPLRKRIEDIPVMINYFLDYYSEQLKRKRPLLSKNALELFLNYDYPGNVRELKNIVQRTLMFNQMEVLHHGDIMFSLNRAGESNSIKTSNLNLKQNEETLINEAMEKCGHIQLHAAKLLGISPYSLNRKLKKMNLSI